MAMALSALVLTVMLRNVTAPSVRSITPSKGRVGNTAVIHGEGFRGATVAVKFGNATVQDMDIPNDKTIKVTIPTRDARDPDPVLVTITVNGLPAGEAPFSYKIIGPEPHIGSFVPLSVPAEIAFSLEIMGTDFVSPQGRLPDQILLIGPETIWGWIVTGSITEASFTAEFPAATLAGDYEIVVGFSDGSGASAEGFAVT